MKDIVPILKALGFLESEIKTYKAALDHGPQTVLELTKRTGLSRQATYVAIETLSDRGLMSSALHGKKRLYAAEHPDKLLAYAKRREREMEEKVKDLERSLPELELQIGGERPIVKVFEGKEGLLSIVSDMEHSRIKEVREVGDLDAIQALFHLDELRPIQKRHSHLHGTVKAIYGGESPYKLNPGIERYFLPDDDSGFKADVTLYGDHVAFMTFEGKLHSVIIESKPISRMLKILFDLAFKEARKSLKKK